MKGVAGGGSFEPLCSYSLLSVSDTDKQTAKGDITVGLLIISGQDEPSAAVAARGQTQCVCVWVC